VPSGVAALTAVTPIGEGCPSYPIHLKRQRLHRLRDSAAVPPPSRSAVCGQAGNPALPSPRRIPKDCKAAPPAGRPRTEGSIINPLSNFRPNVPIQGGHYPPLPVPCRLRSPDSACRDHIHACFPAQGRPQSAMARRAIRCRGTYISGQARGLQRASNASVVFATNSRRPPKNEQRLFCAAALLRTAL